MDRGTVSRSVVRLERRGLVYRLSDATDRRVAVINLTEEGADIADQIAAFMLGRELEMIRELTEDEWQAWLAITDKFHRFLAAAYGEDG